MFSDRTESRAKHFFKDILPEEAFTRKSTSKEEKMVDEESVDSLIKEALERCERVSELSTPANNPSKSAENFGSTQPNVPLTGKVIDKILNRLNPQKRGI